MPKIEPKEKQLVAITSVSLGLLISIVSLIGFFVLGLDLPLDWDQLLVIGLMIAVFPPAVTEYMDLRWERGINRNIPRLLREIAESGRTGLTLVRAIEVSAARDYGPLTPELKRLVAQISWGSSLEDSLRDFAKRARTKLAQRTATLIAEVARSGGDIQEVMEQVNRHIGELESIDRERYTQMRPYAFVVYVAVGVFLFTDIMLIRTFFAQIAQLQTSVLQTTSARGIFGGMSAADLQLLKRILFHATIIQSIVGGLVAGKMSEAKLGAGLKHVLILLLISFLSFATWVWSA